MLGEGLTLVLNNQPIILYFLAIVLALLSTKKTTKAMFSLILFLCIGIGGLWDFLVHAFVLSTTTLPELKYGNAGFEGATINLALGISGIIATFASWAYRAAVVTIATIYLWGTALYHLEHMLFTHTLAFNSTSITLIAHILVPLTLLILLAINYNRLRPDLIQF